MSSDRKTRPVGKPAGKKEIARKAYSTPKVRAYGNIREITLGVGHQGNKDSAPGSHKTST
jgi:hypothetical protein